MERMKRRLNVTSIMGRPLKVDDARRPKREGLNTRPRMAWRKKEQVREDKQRKVWRPKKPLEKGQQRKVWRKKMLQLAQVGTEEPNGEDLRNGEIASGVEKERVLSSEGDNTKVEARIDIQGQNFIEGEVSKDNREWLSRSVVGFTINPTDPEIIWGRLLDWQMVMKVTPIGLYKFLVTCDSVETMEEALNSQVFDHVFEYTEQWTEEEVGETRRIWVECHGLPLHGWNKENMMRIGRYIGHVLKVEDKALQNQDFGSFKILVDTTFLKQVDHPITLGLGGHLYEIHVKEYTGGVYWISGDGNNRNRGAGEKNMEESTSSLMPTESGDFDAVDSGKEVVGGEADGVCDGADEGRTEEKAENQDNVERTSVGTQSQCCNYDREKMIGEARVHMRGHWNVQSGVIEIQNHCWEHGRRGDGNEEFQCWTAEDMRTPAQARLHGFHNDLVDLEAGMSFGPPPGFEAQHVKRTWSGGKILRAVWALWTSVTSYSAPTRIQHTMEQPRLNGLDCLQNGFKDSQSGSGLEERMGQHYYREEDRSDEKFEEGPVMDKVEYCGVGREKGWTLGINEQIGKQKRLSGWDHVIEGLELRQEAAGIGDEDVQVLSTSTSLVDKGNDNGLEKRKETNHAGRWEVNCVNNLEDREHSKGAENWGLRPQPRHCSEQSETEKNKRQEAIEAEQSICSKETEAEKRKRQEEIEAEQSARQDDETEALKSLSVAFGLGLQPIDEDEFVENFVDKRAVLRREQKEAKGTRVICTRSVTAKTRSLQ